MRPDPARDGGPEPPVTIVETSAGGVVVRKVAGELHVLVIKDPYQKYGLPKGHVESGETPAEAALREVAEETSLVDLQLGEELVTIDWYFRARGRRVHKFTTFFLMYSEHGDPKPEVREGITECVWIPLATAHQQISYENASEVVQVAQRILLGEEEGGRDNTVSS